MGFTGGSGGSSSSISTSNDVSLNNPTSENILTYDSTVAKWKNAPASQVVVRYNSTASAWPARPIGATWGVLFLSTNNAAAIAPSDANLAAGDRWLRHPNAS